MNEKVAVIIPVYNSSSFLDECIKSIISQTYKNIEIILINDGSTDNSLEIIKKYATEDNRIRYYSIKNSGVSTARNTGLKMCTSSKVIFVDSDDMIVPNLVEQLVRNSQNVDFVMCGYEVYDMKKEIYHKYSCPMFSGSIKEFCNQLIDYIIPPYLLGPCFKLFDINIIKKWDVIFPTDISYGEDAEFVLTYLEHVKNVRCFNDIGYVYRQYNLDTLSKRFRKDKMAIYNRINSHILNLLSSNKSFNCLTSICNRYIQNYVEYSKELFVSNLIYTQKKKLFFEMGYNNLVLDFEEKSGKNSFAQKLLLISLKTKLFFPVYFIFSLREKIISR